MEKTRDKVTYLIKMWFWFEAFLPILIIAGLWPIGIWLLNLKEPFLATFSSADLIPMGALFMLGVWKDIESNRELSQIPSGKFVDMKFFTIIFPIILLLVYGYIKSNLQNLDRAQNSTYDLLYNYSYFSIAVIVFCVCFCLYAKSRITEEVLSE